MNNTKRSINFSIAFMAVISIITFIVPNINLESFGNHIDIIFPNLLFFLFVVVFSTIQLIFRLLVTSKHYIKDKLFFSLNMTPAKIYNRTIMYLVAITFFLWPVIVSRDLSLIKLSAIINLLLWILIIELLLYISTKYTKIHFLSDGVLVRGLDLRMDVPLGENIFNHSGFYPYYDIQNYSIRSNTLKLILYNNRGTLEAYVTDDRIKPISAFFESKKIGNIDKF